MKDTSHDIPRVTVRKKEIIFRLRQDNNVIVCIIMTRHHHNNRSVGYTLHVIIYLSFQYNDAPSSTPPSPPAHFPISFLPHPPTPPKSQSQSVASKFFSLFTKPAAAGVNQAITLTNYSHPFDGKGNTIQH